MSDLPGDRRADDGPDRDAGAPPVAFPATGAGSERHAAGETAGDGTRGDGVHSGEGQPGEGRPGEAGSRPAGERDRRQRRRRQLIVAGVAVAAALLVIALCAAGLAALRALSGDPDDDDREVQRTRQRQDSSCLELEERLNRVAPPGSTANPPARAGAIRNENAALRPYLSELEVRDRESGRALDGWRQLLDARTAYAEALDKQAPSRTPAFFVAPRTPDGIAVTDQLARWSPAACAGPVRRLAAPDL